MPVSRVAPKTASRRARPREWKTAGASGPGLLIRGGWVVDPSQKLDGIRDVYIKERRVKDVGVDLHKKPALADAAVIDARGLWVLPGLVDMHVHLREPGREGAETIASGTRAAAAGGVTTVLAMPNTEPPIDSPALVRALQAKASAEGLVNVVFSAAVTVGQKGERLTELAALAQAGARAVTDDGKPVRDAEVLRRALEYCRDLGLLLIDHCEDERLSGGAPLHEGLPADLKGVRGAPWAAETALVVRDIALAELTGARLHVAHVSAKQSVAAIRQARARGVPVTAEATPHHFALCDEDIPGYDPDFKMNPPLRGSSDRAAIRAGLADGTIGAVATDHAPHEPALKAAGLSRSPFGVIGLETSLALALTELVPDTLDRSALVERMSAAPARLLGLHGKGSLRPGFDADVALVDPAAEWTVSDFLSKSRNSPFKGRRLKGRVKMTIVGGRVVHDL